MSDIPEAMGTAVEGGLLAQAVESESAASHNEVDGHCLNCGATPTGAFCQDCGQRAHVHRTLSAIWHDIVHGVLHLDGKLWRTLPLLAWKPGELTRRYIDGERAKFVSPMAMFLFSVFLMFAVFQLLGLSTPTSLSAPDLEATADQAQVQLENRRTALEQEIAALPEDDPGRAELQAGLAEVEDGLARLEDVRQIDLGKDGNWSFNLTGVDGIDQGLVKKWRENPSLMLYKLQNNFYKFSWLLIPISIPFVWILFAWKRRFKAYDHAIFVTYSLAFMSLLFLTLSLLGILGLPAAPLILIGVLLPIVHIYRQLRGAYELRRFSALWRTFVLTTIIVFVVLSIFLWVLLLLGAL